MQLGSGVAVAGRKLVAAALIRPLAWEPPHASGAALKRQTKEKNISFEYSHILFVVLCSAFPMS